MTHYLLFKKEHEDNGSIRDGLFYLTRRDILETAITQADEGREFVKPSLRTLCYAHGRNINQLVSNLKIAIRDKEKMLWGNIPILPIDFDKDDIGTIPERKRLLLNNGFEIVHLAPVTEEEVGEFLRKYQN